MFIVYFKIRFDPTLELKSPCKIIFLTEFLRIGQNMIQGFKKHLFAKRTYRYDVDKEIIILT